MFATIVSDERECIQTPPKSKHGFCWPGVLSAAVRSTETSPNVLAPIESGKFDSTVGPPPGVLSSALALTLPNATRVARSTVDSVVQSVLESTFTAPGMPKPGSVYHPYAALLDSPRSSPCHRHIPTRTLPAPPSNVIIASPSERKGTGGVAALPSLS